MHPREQQLERRVELYASLGMTDDAILEHLDAEGFTKVVAEIRTEMLACRQLAIEQLAAATAKTITQLLRLATLLRKVCDDPANWDRSKPEALALAVSLRPTIPRLVADVMHVDGDFGALHDCVLQIAARYDAFARALAEFAIAYDAAPEVSRDQAMFRAVRTLHAIAYPAGAWRAMTETLRWDFGVPLSLLVTVEASAAEEDKDAL
jgi:hypothetical protein